MVVFGVAWGLVPIIPIVLEGSQAQRQLGKVRETLPQRGWGCSLGGENLLSICKVLGLILTLPDKGCVESGPG